MLDNLNDLKAFIVIAQTGSFTKAAGLLGVSQSALSYTMKSLEHKLGLKLLHRTTRSVSTTQAGTQLLQDIQPLMQSLEEKLSQLNNFRETTTGKIRINATEHVISFLLWHKLTQFSQDYPDVQLEITTDYTLTDIIQQRYDFGIRLGEQVDKDMIAVRVSEDLEMILVASPQYLTQHGHPTKLHDLDQHRCIGMRLPTHDKIMGWEFLDSSGHVISMQPRFCMIVSHARLKVKASVDHLGIAWLPKSMVMQELATGQLLEILSDSNMRYSGYYMYYPSRNAGLPLFRLFIEALRLN